MKQNSQHPATASHKESVTIGLMVNCNKTKLLTRTTIIFREQNSTPSQIKQTLINHQPVLQCSWHTHAAQLAESWFQFLHRYGIKIQPLAL
jgi:DUF438 domain-containing protein